MKNEASTDLEKINVHGQRGYLNTFHERKQWRAKWPNTFQLPGVSLPKIERRHRDLMQRANLFSAEDYYLSPYDGHLAKLFVQSTQEIYDADPNSTWRRTFIRNQSPLILQVANWVLHTIPNDDQDAAGEDLLLMGLKWVPACAAILLLMIFPVQVSGEVRNGGKYDSLAYKFWGYPYHPKNPQEARTALQYKTPNLPQSSMSPQHSQMAASYSALNPIAERPVEPEYLCFLQPSEGMKKRTVSQWKAENKREATYVLVSYTSEQFRTEEEQLFLHEVGEHAARAAGVEAYWVGCSCLGKTKEEQENNVWLISDIVRGARSLVIAVASPSTGNDSQSDAMTALHQWGTRVWTLPEVLLITPNSNIDVYARDRDFDHPLTFSKRKFATLWEDAAISRELIDHYEGNLILSSLELVTIALRCLHNRQKGFYLRGDMAYALMGLLRRRPKVVKTDSAFQAFARLSLANDNDQLLERLICILPKSMSQPWYDMQDQWHVSLWDIVPTTQVCGVADEDTVIIDGGYAASIRWKAFAHVANLTRDSWRRFFFRYLFRSTSYLFIVGIALVANGSSLRSAENYNGVNHAGSDIYLGIGATFLTFALILTLFSPYIIRLLYTGKIWGTQAWFFGFEGYMDISTIEEHIFGADMGHLKWSTNGSPLSVHEANEHGECIGMDPVTTNPETARRVRAAVHARMGDERIFTLVDTNTLTVTLFAAQRPPVAVVLCGEEGGMQRALLCSYDWATQTLYRETVMRMETVVLEQMTRVGRLRLGLNRPA
ncbi:MAG: hypothetical protein HETSPECPRED_003460 [Heterodermia speciosa]|uniref:Uncharacterized protein n=1 Tax=Heterodermia speciosa TaxID=116794 RepID=A0A8H3I8H1_9LECA|nr:MAG: hypothetical protein HETSPECPRED_003460 [Heterodermia speciosa]